MAIECANRKRSQNVVFNETIKLWINMYHVCKQRMATKDVELFLSFFFRLAMRMRTDFLIFRKNIEHREKYIKRTKAEKKLLIYFVIIIRSGSSLSVAVVWFLIMFFFCSRL